MRAASLPNLLHFSQVGLRSIQNGNGLNVKFYGCLKSNLGVGTSIRQICTVKSGQLNSPVFYNKSNLKINGKSLFGKTLLRQMHGSGREFGGPQTLERLRLRDGVPNSYTLIYRSNLPNYLLSSQVFLFITIAAVVTGGLIFLISEQEEEERQLQKDKQLMEYDVMKQKEKESTLGQFVAEVKSSINDKRDLYDPNLRDVILEREDPVVLSILGISFIALGIALFKLQRMVPVRIYMGIKNKKHCIAIMYGHILPGRLTWHEFGAGTLRPYKKGTSPTKYLDYSVFKDGSGKTIVLMDRYFRTPREYNKVMGFHNEEDDEEEQEEMSRFSRKRR